MTSSSSSVNERVVPAQLYTSASTVSSTNTKATTPDEATPNRRVTLYQSFRLKRFLSMFLLGSLFGISLEFISSQSMRMWHHLLQVGDESTPFYSFCLFYLKLGAALDIIIYYGLVLGYNGMLLYKVWHFERNTASNICPKTWHFFTSFLAGMVSGICIGMSVFVRPMGWFYSVSFVLITVFTLYFFFHLACDVKERLQLRKQEHDEKQNINNEQDLLEQLI